MYDILIVDDEPAARKSLEYLLDWEKHGFQIADEASNGEEALALMAGHSLRPASRRPAMCRSLS